MSARDDALAVLAKYEAAQYWNPTGAASDLAGALRGLLDEPITDAQVEAAVSAFWLAINDDPVIDPGDFPAMRVALEAARDAS